ncbi:MAG TPA: isoprenylcysteine carboxylmethyltransferase family protein [Lacunisphaera sp.]|nr:isoprenylcysteine carboxylmethyltransferase family protein [Lacunisphaera sp.]
MRRLENRIPPLVTFAVMGAAMWAVARTVPAANFSLPAGHLLAAALGVAGFAVATLGVISFRRARTTVNPLQPGAASALVVSGVYRLTRNPMYLGLLLMLAGWGMYLGHAIALALSAAYVPLMNRLQIQPEERALAAKFGPAFAAYQARARRWL